jgi:hypothetical protein
MSRDEITIRPITEYERVVAELYARAKHVLSDSKHGRRELLEAARRFVKVALLEEFRTILERKTGYPCEVRIRTEKKPVPNGANERKKNGARTKNPGGASSFSGSLRSGARKS